MRSGRSACVLCSQACGIVATVDDDRIVSVRGDDADPASEGYICNKADGWTTTSRTLCD